MASARREINRRDPLWSTPEAVEEIEIGLAKEIGMPGVAGPIELLTDASAAKSFASRRGLGRQRHVDTIYLWLQ